MLVLAAVPTDQFHKLRRAAAPRFPVVHARTWDDALATIRTRPVELATVHPELEGRRRPPAPAAVAVPLALARPGSNAAFFPRLAAPPPRLREALANEEGRAASRQLLD